MPYPTKNFNGSKVPAAVATPEALSSTSVLVSQVIIQAGRAARAANVGSVYIGTTSTNDAQAIALAPGASMTLTAPVGKCIDLSTLYVDAATLTDGVNWMGVQ